MSDLSREMSDKLLDGTGDGPAALRQLLAAAARPGSPAELRGEHAARAAFVASARRVPHGAGALPAPARAARAWRRIVIGKTIAAIALTAGAGGVAVAATSTARSAEPPTVTTIPAPPRTVSPSRVADVDLAPGVDDPDVRPAPPGGSVREPADGAIGPDRARSAERDPAKNRAPGAPADPPAATPDRPGPAAAPPHTTTSPPVPAQPPNSGAGAGKSEKPEKPEKAEQTGKTSKTPPPDPPRSKPDTPPGQLKKSAAESEE